MTTPPRIAVALAGALLAAGALALFALDGSESPLDTAPDGSTLASTWVDTADDGALEVGPGEPFHDRTDLAPASSSTGEVATIAQISDAHVRDEESPARAVLLDRLSPLISEAARPQESLSTQVLDAALRSASALEPDAILETGDLIDSAQANELKQALSVLEGGAVDPDSGHAGYEGLQAESNPDPFLYRPDLDSPRHPGLLDQAQEPFEAGGAGAPWYPVLGNHDLLAQGEVPPTPALEAIATGDRQLVELDRDLETPEDATTLTPELVDRFLGDGLPGRTESVAADSARRYLSESEVVSALRAASNAGGSGDRLEYSFDVGERVRVIVLDIVNRGGGAAGLVEPDQIEWLRGELDAAGDRWVLVASHQPLTTSEGGEAALSLLDSNSRVIATLSGHAHSTSIEPRETPSGGYWQIAAPALADYPQQVRAIEVSETEDGVAIETWMLDTAPGELSDISRELAYLDAGGGRPDGDEGDASDRNARLFLAR